MELLGIFGGTFNPIHYGHLRIAQETAEAFALKQVKFLPAARPPLKNMPDVSALHRAEMVRLAIADNPSFSLDTRELARTGPSYTVDTLAELKKEYHQQALCLMIGSDAFARFDEWHKWQSILDYCHLIVVSRPPSASNTLPNATVAAYLNQHQAHQPAQLFEQKQGLIIQHPVTALDISSSQIRDMVYQRKMPLYLCPDVVVAYIQQHHLYR